jgi:uncharacterized protein with NAD-binding domain and iron-sulfur cluster
VTLMQEVQAGEWTPWRFDLPHRAGTPGDFHSAPFVTLVDYTKGLLFSMDKRLRRSDWSNVRGLGSSIREAAELANRLPPDPARVSRQQRADLQARVTCFSQTFQQVLEERIAEARALGTSRGQSAPLRDADIVLIELASALTIGLLSDDVFEQGFDVLDEEDWCCWMSRNGCHRDALDSAIVKACYDYVFGVTATGRDFGAGTATRLLLKFLFGYKGAFFYVMHATMGELVFAPLYKVLRDRDVDFQFFHRVDELVTNADGSSIEQIRMTIQAKPIGDAYDPLIDVPDGLGGTLASWPNEPKFDALCHGGDIQGHDLESAWSAWPGVGSRTLRRGDPDAFDRVVLGIGLGALPWICADLSRKHERWRAMFAKMKTIPTMALQVWTACANNHLVQGPRAQDADWQRLAKDHRVVLSGFSKPLDTWGDLSLQLGQEDWPDGARPHGLHYFVSSYRPDVDIPPPGAAVHFPETQLAAVRTLQRAWVDNHLARLWPGFGAGHQPNWDMLFDPAGGQGSARLDAQYARVNLNHSDQYVQSVAGSLTARLTADGSGIDNLALAGDWVRTGINAGCVESAVMAGRAAASAITGVEIDMPNANDFEEPGLVNAALPVLSALRKIEHAASGGTGHIDAHVIIDSRPVEDVRSRLPPGVKLKDDKSARHDLVFVFARQHGVRPGLLPFGGLRYLEVFELVPGVVVESSNRRIPFNYMPHLLVDALLPVLIGQTAYGFNKQLARIQHSEGSFDVRGSFGQTQAQFGPIGLPGPIGSLPDVADLASLLQLPLIGLASDGTFVMSHVHFELHAGTFQRVGGAVSLGAPFGPSQRQMVFSGNGAPGPWGFRMTCPWRLSMPITGLGGGMPASRPARSLVAQYGQSVMGRFGL